MKRIVTRLAAGVLAGGATLVGGIISAAPASAAVDEGHYVMQTISYGVIPGPESNVTVVGNRLQQDFDGFGPQNLWSSTITPTADGFNTTYGADPVTQWVGHMEVHKTPTGYYGTQYVYGQLPIGNVVLTKTPRRANQPA